MQIAYTFLVIRTAGSNIGAGADICITMNRVPTLVGIDGAFRGETYPLEHFKTYIVGRSRNADISLRRTQHYRNQSDEQRDADKAAKTVSARHFQITYLNSKSIEIKNLSVNGTRLDGTPIGGAAVIDDIATKSHIVSFGADEKFKLELRAVELSVSDSSQGWSDTGATGGMNRL